jgi:hypothetical protein
MGGKPDLNMASVFGDFGHTIAEKDNSARRLAGLVQNCGRLILVAWWTEGWACLRRR